MKGKEATGSEEVKNLLRGIHKRLKNHGITDEEAFNATVNLLLAKTYDEIQLLGGREPDFQVRQEDFSNKSGFYSRINSLFQNALIYLLGESHENARRQEILNHEDKEEILLAIVPHLERINFRSLRFLEEDSLGDIFLDFMPSIFRQDRGVFFTHPNICRFVCKGLNIQEAGNKLILDPSCGSGTFLIEALKLAFKNCPTDGMREKTTKTILGMDNEPKSINLCKVNMVIHCDGSASVYTGNALLRLDRLPLRFIKTANILRNQECTPEVIQEGRGVDFIITNPPFSLEVRKDQCGHFKMKDFVSFKKDITLASECLFAERWYQLLNPKGRLGAVLPFSLFDSDEYLKARLLFLCYFRIVALVGLPEHAFSPYARQRTLLVFAERRTLEESNHLFSKIDKVDELVDAIGDEKVIFYDAKEVGYVRTKKKRAVITINTNGNDLTDEVANIIASAFEGNYQKHPQITLKTLEEVYKERGLVLTPAFLDKVNPLEEFSLGEEWKIAEVEKIRDIDAEDLLICETGDIVADGAGIITPRSLKNMSAIDKERIKRKILSGKFGLLKEGDVIIAPVRPYMKKIAVITKSATKFLFSKDFIVLRRKNPDLEKSLFLFLTLTQDMNIKKLVSLCSTGKSGYPKIKNKSAILRIKFSRVEISPESITRLASLYNDIYEMVFNTRTTASSPSKKFFSGT